MQIEGKRFYQVPLMGLAKLALMFFFQMVVGSLLLGLGEDGPPETYFLVSIGIITFITGCADAVAYLVIGNKLRIRNRLTKGLVFGMFVFFSNYLPQSLGLAGAVGENVLMTFEWKHAVFDFLTTIPLSLLLGRFFTKEPEKYNERPQARATVSTVFVCSVLFVVLMIGVTQLTALVFPGENLAACLQIDPGKKILFYSVFYLCFLLTGILMPLYYLETENGTARSAVRYSLVYGLLIWAPVVLAMIAFHVSAVSAVIFIAESFAVILLTVLAAAKLHGWLARKSAVKKETA